MSLRDHAVADVVEQALLGQVTANPSAPGPRIVYADWLESVGRSAHAEFLRVQLALADIDDATAPAFRAASAQLAELAARLEPGWRARVAIAFVEGCPPEVARRRMVAVSVRGGGGPPRRFVFDKPEVTIGSVAGNDIVLEGEAIDRRHARIVWKDGKTILVDLRSDRGTWLNGRRISSPLVITPADAVAIGELTLAVEDVAVGERPTTETVSSTTKLAMELVCPQRWDWLTPTADADVRHCGACQRDVRYFTTVEEARVHAVSGGCVAIDVERLPTRRANDLDPPRREPLRMLGAMAPPPQPRTVSPRPPPPEGNEFESEDPTTPYG